MDISYKIIENPDASKKNSCVEITMGPCEGVILEFGAVEIYPTFENGKPLPKWRWRSVIKMSPAKLARKKYYLNLDYYTDMKVLSWGILKQEEVNMEYFKEFTDQVFEKIMTAPERMSKEYQTAEGEATRLGLERYYGFQS